MYNIFTVHLPAPRRLHNEVLLILLQTSGFQMEGGDS